MRIFPFKIWMWRKGYLANLAWMCCDKGSSTYPLNDSFFVFAFASYWQESRFGLRWILLYTLTFQMMLTHVSDSSLKGALSLTSYGISLMNWKKSLFVSLCLINVFVMFFQSSSSTQVGRIDNEWLWSRYLCTRYERSKNSTKLFFSSRMKNSSNSSWWNQSSRQ